MIDIQRYPGRTVFEAYGWNDLAEKLVGCPGATTPWPEKPEEQAEAEEELLQRLVDLNHQRAAEEAQGKIPWLRPEYQAPEETAQQAELKTDSPENKPTSQQINWFGLRRFKPRSAPSATSSKPQPWTPTSWPASSSANRKNLSSRFWTPWPNSV